ncbi:superoxide dismutase family protein [Nonomuraea sp. NPDC050783]|uniref:superoxide dismutase family protein n=1 Tax=Nonomuraea sp. NPDC050783 TaxID=3154634 RepID=UPI00346565BE
MRVPAFLFVLLAAAGCAGPPAPVDHDPAPDMRAAPAQSVVTMSGGGEFAPVEGNASAEAPSGTPAGASPAASPAASTAVSAAVVYDRKLVPEGAQGSVTVESSGGRTRTSLVVEGLLPDHHYGAHLHTRPCGAAPADAGPHYQHHPGQVDAVSEVWLDFTTDDEGAGRASAGNDWSLEPTRLPGSLVIHAGPTVTSGPQAGTAGDRVACLALR